MTDQRRPMDAERLAEMRARAEAATPGPWKTIWPCNCEEISISRDGARNHREIHMTAPDATFIAHARQDIPDLLAEVARLRAERDAAIQRHAAQEDFWTDWLNQFVALMDDTWDDDMSMDAIVFDWAKHTAAELSRLRAVIEEARGHLDWAGKSMTYKEFNDSVLVAKDILDRGLKGEA